MTLPDPRSIRAHPVRELLVLDDPAFHPVPFPSERYRARRVGGWDALLAAVRRTPPSTAVLVAAFDAAGEPDPRIRELLTAAPLLPVLAAVDLGSGAAAAVGALLRWGVSEVVDARLEGGPEALSQRFRAAHARPFKRRLGTALSRYVSADAMTLVRAAAEVACDRGLSPALAGIFGVKERTVGDWCRREGLPPPRRLLAWFRVLLAVALLEESTRSWNNVARSTGYVDASSLRRAIAGFVPRADADSPAPRPRFSDLIAAFERELRGCRERVRDASRLRVPAHLKRALEDHAGPEAGRGEFSRRAGALVERPEKDKGPAMPGGGGGMGDMY